MLLIDLFGWWYSRGWAWITHQLFAVKSKSIADFFSIQDLLRTLFAPFRQDTIDTKKAPIGVKLQAFGGNIISRFLGFLIRGTLIIIGLGMLLLNVLVGVCVVLIWPLIPISPVVAVVFIAIGVGL